MNNWVAQVGLIFCFFMACAKFLFGIFLEAKGKLPTVLNTLSAHLEALVDLLQWLIVIIKAVHAASGTLVVHDIELLIQECIEYQLSLCNSFLCFIKHFFLHVIHNMLVLWYLEELHGFVMLLHFLVLEVNFQFFLEVLMSSIVFKPPWFDISFKKLLFWTIILISHHFSFLLEKSWFLCFTFGFFKTVCLLLFLVI